MLRGAGPNGELLGIVGVERDVGFGNGRGEHLHCAGGRRGLQGVDNDPVCLLGRLLLGQLLYQIGDLLVDLRRCPSDQLALLSTGREPCVGQRVGEELECVGYSAWAHSLQRVDHHPGVLRVGSLHVHVFQRALDHLVISRTRPGDELVGAGPRVELGLGGGQPEDLHRGSGGDRLHRVDDRGGGQFGRSLCRHPLQRLGDGGVVRFASPGQDRAGLGIGGKSYVGQKLLEHLHGHRGIHVGHRVDGELLLQFGRNAGIHLLDHQLDLLVLCRTGPNDQPPGLLVDDEVGVGEQPLEHRKHTIRVGRLDLIDAQTELLVLGCLALELFQDLDDYQVLGRFRPDGQLARLIATDYLDLRQLFGECAQKRLEPLLLRGRDGVHHQPFGLFRRRAGFKLLDRRLDDLVIRRRGHRHHAIILRVQRDLCLGDQLLKDRDQVVGRLLNQRMETQHGRIWARCLRLQLLQRGLDRLLVGWDRQRNQAVGLRVEAKLGIRHQVLQQGEHRVGIRLGQAIDFQLRGAYR